MPNPALDRKDYLDNQIKKGTGRKVEDRSWQTMGDRVRARILRVLQTQDDYAGIKRNKP